MLESPRLRLASADRVGMAHVALILLQAESKNVSWLESSG
jgi:hypothetical protein